MNILQSPKILLGLCSLLLCLVSINSNAILASAPPFITSVVPSYGGTEGGTRITIYGYNFAQNGIFSQYNVFIGNEPCSVIPYYSTDGQIVCLTPKCTTSFCQDPTWQGNHVVSLDIYLQTVESILGTFATFTFDGGKTPELMSMSHYSWGSATSHIAGKITAAYLDDVSIFIGGTGNIGGSNAASIGEAGDINAELWGNSYYRWYYSDYPVYYRPPTDMAAGVYNLSLVVQDLENVGWGSGSARTFPVQYPLAIGSDHRHQYLYDAALSGTPYNLILFPNIGSVYPTQGSLAGGNVLTIKGSGFSANASNNIVYASGQRCDVLSADFNTISCQTRSVEAASLSLFVSEIQVQDGHPVAPSNSRWKYNSTRSFGSAGWWVKLWDWNAYNANKFPNSAVRRSFALHQGMSFGLYYDVGSDWPAQLGYSSRTWDSRSFVADFSTVLVAPLTGVYYFYVINVDDDVSLYGTPYNTNREKLLVPTDRSAVRESAGVRLSAGDRYSLRARLINYGGPDNLLLALRIDPEYFNGTAYLTDGLLGSSANSPEEAFSPPLQLSDTFLRHHAVRDIQQVQLSMAYNFEIQVFN